MRQNLLLLTYFLVLSTMMMANPVNKEEARQKALQFMAGKVAASRGTTLSSPDVQLAAAEDYYYVFNIGQSNGFIIVSGDDRTPEILGYSDNGSFDVDNMPDNMLAWLQGYADQIKAIPATAEARQMNAPKKVAKSVVAPLLQTTWDQGSPYNDLCPNDGEGICVTGCVATAMAQIMNYYNWPLGATTEIPGYTAGKSRAALPATVFDWDNMLNSYTGSEVTAAKTAVATLMKYCGWGAQMNYGTGGSGAYEINAERALKNYFGYDQNVRRVIRDNYSIEEWDGIIYNEIHSGRPVMYGGQTSSNAGHEFVCDGVDAEGLYHINWGWSGKGNGYYVLSVLNPNASGIGGSAGYDGYSMDQSAVIGIQKPKNIPLVEELKLTVQELFLSNPSQLLYTRTSVQENFDPIGICAVVANATSTTFTPSFGFAIYEEETLIGVISAYDGVECSPGSFFGKNGNDYSVYTLANFTAGRTGHFKIVPISKVQTSETWLKDGATDRFYIDAIMTETQMTLCVMPIVDLQITKVEYKGIKMQGILQNVEVTVNNNGSEYNGNLYLNVNGNYVSGDCIAIPANSTQVITFHYVPSAGTNNYKVGLYANGSSPLAEGSEEIASYLTTDNIDLDLSMVVNNTKDGAKVLGKRLSVTVTATNNSTEVYNGKFGFEYHYQKGSYDYTGYSNNTSGIRILPGGSAFLNLGCNIENGLTYNITPVQYKNGSWITVGSSVTYTAADGVTVIHADGTTTVAEATAAYTVPNNATFVDLKDQSTISSVDVNNASANCLYLFKEDETAIPEGISKNIIKGTTAANIELVDGADFVPPIDFSATTISYTRTFTTPAGENSGWTTIVLPFDVKEIRVEGKTDPIDWFHSSTDTGKNFWLKKMVSDEAGSVSFEFTDDFKAYTPYIIAVPGDTWGETWNLVGKAITFIGNNNTTVYSNKSSKSTCDYYQFFGTLRSRSMTNVYILNPAGSLFTNGSGTVEPFRAYIRSLTADSPGDILNVKSYQPTPIITINVDSSEKQGVYTLDGRKVGNDLRNVSKGVYIVNGKKVIK